MKKLLTAIVTLGLFGAIWFAAADNEGGNPFDAIWEKLKDLNDQIAGIEQWDDERVVSLEERVNVAEEDLANYEYAFCQTCDESFPTPYSCTRKQAAEKCESLGMKLCSLAELNAHTEATGHRVCCWGWTADPDYDTWDRERGAVAHFMGSSIETDITSGCGGPPGGLRVGFRDHEGLASAHCCEK